MIIDIHNHPDYYGYNPEEFVKNMDSVGIDKTVLLSWECPKNDWNPLTKKCFSPFSDMPAPFERCIAYRQAAPDRFLLGYCPDPREPDAIAKLRTITKMYGISICGELKLRMMYDNPDAIRLYRAAGELGLPVLMHLDYGLDTQIAYPWDSYWYGGGIDVLERVLKACPETNFLGHAPGFWSHISDDEASYTEQYPKRPIVPGGKIEQLLDRYPNLYCDMSAGSGCNALKRDREFTVKFLTRYQDRVLYARDYFDNIHRELLDSLPLSSAVLEKLYSGNAKKLLRGGNTL